MTHNPELQAAAYLAGEQSKVERETFEDHLLSCDECWTEVDAARGGQSAVESIRELAPAHLRASIRRDIIGEPDVGPHARRRLLVAAAVLVLLAGAAAAAVVTVQSSDSSVIAAAVSGYTDDRLPGAAMPKEPAPDLTSMHLTYVAAGAGRVEDMPVTAYAYRDPAGRRLMIYKSTSAFPMPPQAQMLEGPKGAWMTHSDGVMLLFSRHPHELLILGEDDELVHDAAVALDVV